MPADSGRLALFAVPGLVSTPAALNAWRTGAFSPFVRFDVIEEPVTLARAWPPTRTPSWPNRVPVVTSPGAEQLPFSAKFWQRMRPTTSLASIESRRSTSGASAPGRPST